MGKGVILDSTKTYNGTQAREVMKLYVQRKKGDRSQEPIDRFFSHNPNPVRTVRFNAGSPKYYRLFNEDDYEDLEIGESKSFSGCTELVRIA